MQTVLHPPDEFSCEPRPGRESVVVRRGGEHDLGVAGDVAAPVEELLERGLQNVKRVLAPTGAESRFTLVAAEGDG